MAKQETGIEVKVKLVVDNAANRVLFAEAGKDFIDFLFGIQELPFGLVSQLVRSVSEDSISCVSNIRDSISKLPDDYFITGQKDALLDPVVRNCGLKLRLPLEQHCDPKPSTLYVCINQCCYMKSASDNPHVKCSGCYKKFFTTYTLAVPSDEEVVAYLDGEGGYVKGVANFMVMDDLMVKPLQFDSCFNLLKKCNMDRIGEVEEKVVSVGLDEGKKLLEAALRSKTALTDTFLPNKLGNIVSYSDRPYRRIMDC